MESNQKQQFQSGDGQQEAVETSSSYELKEGKGELAPGIPIVRTSTPKPLSFGPGLTPVLPSFPTKAPSAPPLPEELDDSGEIHTSGAIPAVTRSAKSRQLAEEMQEFDWLFEYSIEMDPVELNNEERLNGLALLYGPGVAKGYTLCCGRVEGEGTGAQTIATLQKSSEEEAEVWGILYRIPRRLIERTDGGPSLLDAMHGASTPAGIFEEKQILVRDSYRNREIRCVTFVATSATQERLQMVASEQEGSQFIQRLSSIARKQKLPDSYIASYPETLTTVPHPEAKEDTSDRNSDRLPGWRERRQIEKTPRGSASTTASDLWLIVLAFYLMLVFLTVMTFAVFQALGFGSTVLTQSFAPLGIPWLVLVYGLLGGCISCLISVGRMRVASPPIFVIVTWFTRPYIGVVLAMLSYLLLNCGLFSLTSNSEQQMALFLLVAVLAGLCEGWLFFRQRS